MIFGIVIYLILAGYFIRRFSRRISMVGMTYEYSFWSIIAGLFFPISILIVFIMYLKGKYHGIPEYF